MVSILIYSSVSAISILFAWLARKNNEKLWIFLAALVLSIITGLRGVDVGIDTKAYFSAYNSALNGKMNEIFCEIGFKYAIWFLANVFKNPNIMFFLFSLVTNSLILFRLWDFKEQISIGWAVFIYCAQFYFFTFNLVRQFFAISIVFFATRFIKNQDYIIFAIITVCAALFHVSSLMGLLFLFIDLLFYKKIDNKKRAIKQLIILLILGVGFLIGIIIFENNIFTSTIKRIVEYFKNITFNFGMMLPFKLFLLFFLFGIILSERPIKMNNVASNKEYGIISNLKLMLSKKERQVLTLKEEYDYYSIFYTYGLGLFILVLEWFFPFTGRLSFIFYIFECVYIALAMKKCKNGYVKIAVLSLFLYVFFNDIMISTQGQTPYMFAWQSVDI